MENKTAIVFGSSGLIGGELVKILVNNSTFNKIILPVRSINITLNHPKLHQIIIDFDRMSDYANELKGDIYFLCLGTTMAKAKSKEAFFKVDFTYTFEAAGIACKSNSSHVLLVSSLGADVQSMFYYSRIKGEIEKAISELGCHKLSIFRPSLLLGERAESRSGEKWATKMSSWFSFLFIGPLKSYKPILAATVAKSMMQTSIFPHSENVKIFSSSQIDDLLNQ